MKAILLLLGVLLASILARCKNRHRIDDQKLAAQLGEANGAMDELARLLSDRPKFFKAIHEEFDLNGSEFIELSEFQRAVTEVFAVALQPVPESEELEKMFRKLDKNEDGKLDFAEFTEFIRKNVKHILGRFRKKLNEAAWKLKNGQDEEEEEETEAA